MNSRVFLRAFLTGTSLIGTTFAQAAKTAQRAAAIPVDESMLGETGSLILIVALVVGGVVLMMFLRKRQAAADTHAHASIDPNGLKPGEIRMYYRPKKKKKMRLRAKDLDDAMEELEEIENMPAPQPMQPKKDPLPVFSFIGLEKAPHFEKLPEMTDADLLMAIEQTQDEFEDDVEMRVLSLKILAAFRASNSIFALGQVALYDLSSKLRSSAIGYLADIDHESVFDTLVTACADPTREVRAAAARALFKLTFNRAHAWTRIIESQNMERMRQAARSAIAGDLVLRSLERLVSKDQKAAYEAFSLTALLIKSNETEPIIETLINHKNDELKMALLHAMQVFPTEATFNVLTELVTYNSLTTEIVNKVDEVRSSSRMLVF